MDLEALEVEFDGTGVPTTKKEVAGRKGKQSDGSSKTREAKLGCVFAQTHFGRATHIIDLYHAPRPIRRFRRHRSRLQNHHCLRLFDCSMGVCYRRPL